MLVTHFHHLIQRPDLDKYWTDIGVEEVEPIHVWISCVLFMPQLKIVCVLVLLFQCAKMIKNNI